MLTGFQHSTGQILELELEPSNQCSVRCAGCSRTVWGSDIRPAEISSTELNPVWLMRLADLNLTRVLINGNYGDFLNHSDPAELAETVTTLWPRAQVHVITHGSAGSEALWHKLAQLNITVEFGIDGLDQATHARYRAGSDLDQVLANARYFISQGGAAHWSFISFDHNAHQLEAARSMAIQLGFSRFHSKSAWTNSQTQATPRVNHNLEVTDWIWPQTQQPAPAAPDQAVVRQFSNRLKSQAAQGLIPVRAVAVHQHSGFRVFCPALKSNRIYLSSEGLIYPYSHWAKPLLWRNLLNHWQIPEGFNDLKNRYVADILGDDAWQSLDHSLNTENPMNVCAHRCGVKSSNTPASAQLEWNKSNRVDVVWEHGLTPRQQKQLNTDFEQFYSARFGVSDAVVFALSVKGDYQNINVQTLWESFRAGVAASMKNN
jgi:hypothetical protein